MLRWFWYVILYFTLNAPLGVLTTNLGGASILRLSAPYAERENNTIYHLGEDYYRPK